MFTKISSAKLIFHRFQYSGEALSFRGFKLIKVSKKWRKVFENFCSSKNKMFVRETFLETLCIRF